MNNKRQAEYEHYLYYFKKIVEGLEKDFEEVHNAYKEESQGNNLIIKKADKIKEFIFKAEDPFTTSDIKDLLGYSPTYICSYLKKFLDDGSLEIIGNRKTSSKGKLSNVYKVIDREYFNPNPSVEYLLKEEKLRLYRDSESEFEHSEK